MTMPNGRSRCGRRHSSAAVDTESNPIYVKKTMAAPVSTPGNPLGANGFRLEVSTARAAPNTKIKMAAIVISTFRLLVLALCARERATASSSSVPVATRSLPTCETIGIGCWRAFRTRWR